MSPLLPRFRPDETAAEHAEALRKAEEAPARTRGPASAADRWTMRGVPCVGGKDWPGSAIPGTRPGDSLGLFDDD
jgi:hypothetical protein